MTRLQGGGWSQPEASGTCGDGSLMPRDQYVNDAWNMWARQKKLTFHILKSGEVNKKRAMIHDSLRDKTMSY